MLVTSTLRSSIPGAAHLTETPTIRWIQLAHILRPQGRKGEVLADLLTDFPERFDTQPRAFLAREGLTGLPADAREVDIAAYWLPVGRNQGRIVLHFVGIDSISDAESLAGFDVLIPEHERPELEEDTSYVSDLVGSVLFDCQTPGDALSAVLVGVVTDVQFATTPDGARRLIDAAPLLAVQTPSGDEVLIPFVKAFLNSLDPAAKRIEMSLPPGLLEINRS